MSLGRPFQKEENRFPLGPETLPQPKQALARLDQNSLEDFQAGAPANFQELGLALVPNGFTSGIVEEIMPCPGEP
jgi:hypothetical protein